MFTEPPLHIVAELALVMVGTGFTVTVTVCGVPGQLPAVDVGVTVYTTFCADVEVLVMVLLMVEVVWLVVLSPVVLVLLAATHV
jgi:hypothetical protein